MAAGVLGEKAGRGSQFLAFGLPDVKICLKVTFNNFRVGDSSARSLRLLAFPGGRAGRSRGLRLFLIVLTLFGVTFTPKKSKF